MKKIILIFIALLSIYAIACKKEAPAKPKYNIVYKELYNQPLDTIRYYLNGKWQVLIIKGGFADIREYPQNTFFDFNFRGDLSNDTAKYYNDTSVIAYAKVIWPNQNTNIWINDSTFLLRFLTPSIPPIELVVINIKNDTLSLGSNYVEGYMFYCTKVN